MKLFSKVCMAAVLPVVMALAACSPATSGAPAATSAPASAATAISSATPATSVSATAAATTATAAPSATAANTSAPSAAATAAPSSTAMPTLTIAPVPSATRAATTPGIAPGGAVISGTGGTAVTAFTIKGFIFRPEVLQVKVGTTVTWTNMDDIPHSVTNGVPPTPGGAFNTGFFTLGESRSLTFMQPGEYTYFCMRHNSMTGTVQVVP